MTTFWFSILPNSCRMHTANNNIPYVVCDRVVGIHLVRYASFRQLLGMKCATLRIVCAQPLTTQPEPIVRFVYIISPTFYDYDAAKSRLWLQDSWEYRVFATQTFVDYVRDLNELNGVFPAYQSQVLLWTNARCKARICAPSIF